MRRTPAVIDLDRDDSTNDALAGSRTRFLRTCWILLLISVAYVVATTAWVATENRSLLLVVEVLTIWSAVAVLLPMVKIHRAAAE